MPIVRYVGISAIRDRALDALEAALREAGEYLAGQQQDAAPVGPTGDLRASIDVRETTRSGNSVDVVVSTGPEVDDYAIVQEVGAWQNFRGRYGYVAVKRGAPGYMGDTLETFGPSLDGYVRSHVARAL